MDQLFQIYVGRQHQGCIRAQASGTAIERWAKQVKKSSLIFRAERTPSVQQTKQPKAKKA